MNECFSLEILELCWLQGQMEETDLCAHGVVRIRLGTQALEGEVSMSASALHLLRTLRDNHEPDEMAKLFPSDGFCWTPSLGATPYPICLGSCPNGGFDGWVTHEGGFVRISLENLPPVRVPREAYRAEVFRFADAVEGLFLASRPKVVRDDLDKLWYPAFWKEWRCHRNEK